jgi:hypothetical protein
MPAMISRTRLALLAVIPLKSKSVLRLVFQLCCLPVALCSMPVQ